MELLDGDAVSRELAMTPGWELAEDAIVKTVTRKDFAGAMRFVNRVAEEAEAAGHHPDIAIQWNKVTLTLTTHAANGLTDNDFRLARVINGL